MINKIFKNIKAFIEFTYLFLEAYFKFFPFITALLGLPGLLFVMIFDKTLLNSYFKVFKDFRDKYY